MVEDKLAPQIAEKWKWQTAAKKTSSGPEPHPLGEPHDLSEFPGWGSVDQVVERSRL